MVRPGTLQSIEIDYGDVQTYVNDENPLRVIGSYAEGYTQDITDQIDWSISDDSLLSIEDVTGQAIALLTGEGKVNLTAQIGNIETTKTITIAEQTATLERLVLVPNESFSAVDEKNNFRVIGVYTDGSEIDLTQSARWTSDNSTIVEISNNIDYEGEALALLSGDATITAKIGDLSSSVVVSIKSAILEKIDITLQRQTLSVDTSLQLVATGIYTDGSTKDLTKWVAWQSNNNEIIHVSNEENLEGIITGIATGTTFVSATLDGTVDTAEITISNASLVDISIQNINLAFHTGLSSNFYAIGIFSDGRKQDISHLVKWVSSDLSVLSVSNGQDNSGAFSILGNGSATLSVFYNTITSSASIVATASTISRIVIHAAQNSIAEESLLLLSATAIFSDNSSIDITDFANWTSNNVQIVRISNQGKSKGTANAIAIGNATIAVEYLSITAELTLEVNGATLTTINIDPQDINLANNTRIDLTATGTFSNNTVQDITQQVLWESTNPDVIFVSNATDKKGFAYSLSQGQATISATYNGFSANVIIGSNTVTIDGITLLFDGDNTMPSGSDKTLVAIGNYSNGSTQDLSQLVTWQSANTKICSISTTENNYGKIVALSSGLCTITARFDGLSSTLFFTISEASLQTIALVPTSLSLAQGTQHQLTAIGTYSDASTQDLTNAVTWQTSSATININPQGLLMALSVGDGTVQANQLNVSAKAQITVTAATLQTIQVSPNPLMLSKGETQQLKAIGSYTDNSTQDITQSVLWQGTDNRVATVNNNANGSGWVNALGVGTSVISAKMDGKQVEVAVTVDLNPNAPVSMSLSALPYVILNNGNDTSTIAVKVRAADSASFVINGSKINLSLLTGSGTLNTTSVLTTDGFAEFSLQSSLKGVITVQASVEGTDIINYVSIYSTDNFAEVIGRGVLLSAKVVDDVVQIGSVFGLAILNYANRPFTISEFKLGTRNSVIYTTTSPDVLNNNTLPPGQVIIAGWITEQERENTFVSVFWLAEPVTGVIFPIAVSYDLPPNN